MWCWSVWKEDQAFGEAEKGCESFFFFCTYCSSSYAIGESLCVFCFLYVKCHFFHFLALLTGTWGEQAVGHSVELHEVTVWTEGTVMTLQLLWRLWEDPELSSTAIELWKQNEYLILSEFLWKTFSSFQSSLWIHLFHLVKSHQFISIHQVNLSHFYVLFLKKCILWPVSESKDSFHMSGFFYPASSIKVSKLNNIIS